MIGKMDEQEKWKIVNKEGRKGGRKKYRRLGNELERATRSILTAYVTRS
jgi:hypothetical protein